MIGFSFFLLYIVAGDGTGYAFAQYPTLESKTYIQIEKQSLYITMRDGTEIAIDLLLPENRKPDQTFPTIVELTRYWRDYEPHQKRTQPLSNPFVSRGYAVVMADVRGTGASFGSRPHPWSEKELTDCYDLAEWITKQPWSNGSIGAHGVSYSGTSAALMAVAGHKAVKVVIPQFYEFDVYTDIAFPGGIFNRHFVKEWSAYNTMLDANQVPESQRSTVVGVSPADEDKTREKLRKAVQSHKENINVYQAARTMDSRDDSWGVTQGGIEAFSLHTRQAQMDSSDAFLYLWGSWMDAGTAQAVLHHMKTTKRPVRAVIGAWNHGGETQASPFGKPGGAPNPGQLGQAMEIAKAYDYFLKGKETDVVKGPKLYYYTMGEERWRSSAQWPPSGLTTKTFFLNHGGRLDAKAKSGETIRYEVDFKATTGTTNRWYTQLGGPVIYPNRKQANKRCLTFTGPALPHSTEITGHPSIQLAIKSSASDGAFYAYLEAVAPNNEVIYLTDGQLRGVYRQPYQGSKYASLNQNPSFRHKDRQPMVPGTDTELNFSLLPTSVVVPKGYRLRISLAGHDADTFKRIPAKGSVTWQLASGKSKVDIPLRFRPELYNHTTKAAISSGLYEFENGAQFKLIAESNQTHLEAQNQAALALMHSVPKNAEFFNQAMATMQEFIHKKQTKQLQKMIHPDKKASRLIKIWNSISEERTPKLIGTIESGGQIISVVEIVREGTVSALLVFWHPTKHYVDAIRGGEGTPHITALSATGNHTFTASNPELTLGAVQVHGSTNGQPPYLEIKDQRGKLR